MYVSLTAVLLIGCELSAALPRDGFASRELIWDAATLSTSWRQRPRPLSDGLSAAEQVALSPVAIQKVAARMEESLFRLERTGCDVNLDVVLVQDRTASYEDDLPYIRMQLPAMIATLKAIAPHTRFGLVDFQDKPYPPLGEFDDVCYHLAAPLSRDGQAVLDAYATMQAFGGGDLPESQFTALVSAALDQRVGWMNASHPDFDPAIPSYRLLLLATDAQPHLQGDIHKFDPSVYTDLPYDLPPHWGGVTQSDPLSECRDYDYPAETLVKEVLNRNDISLGIITPSSNSLVTATWTWFNEIFLEQASEMYAHVAEDSSDLSSAITTILEEVFSHACPTEAPVTRRPTPSTQETSTEETSTEETSTEETSTEELIYTFPTETENPTTFTESMSDTPTPSTTRKYGSTTSPIETTHAPRTRSPLVTETDTHTPKKTTAASTSSTFLTTEAVSTKTTSTFLTTDSASTEPDSGVSSSQTTSTKRTTTAHIASCTTHAAGTSTEEEENTPTEEEENTPTEEEENDTTEEEENDTTEEEENDTTEEEENTPTEEESDNEECGALGKGGMVCCCHQQE